MTAPMTMMAIMAATVPSTDFAFIVIPPQTKMVSMMAAVTIIRPIMVNTVPSTDFVFIICPPFLYFGAYYRHQL